MKEILEKIKISKGELVEENLSSGQITANTESKNQPNVTQPESSLSEESTASEKPVKNEQTETPVMTDSDNNNTQNISVVIPVENKPVILSESMQEIEPIINEYGIYIVRPGDNIWNIHFKLLRDYFRNKGINLSPKSDEPITRGFSSGIGKILKFSESMVSIYNVVDEKLEDDINIIQPMSKIVIYNMSDVFSLLELIDYNTVNQIKFDGESIWILTEDADLKQKSQ